MTPANEGTEISSEQPSKKTAKKKTAKKKTAKKTAKDSAPRKKAPKKGSESPLLAARAAIEKGLKGRDCFVNLDPDSLENSLPHIPTNSIVLDRLIGGIPNARGVQPCPGLPRGKILQLYGTEGAGKTTTALEIAASTISSGGTVCYIDYENEIVPTYAEALGVPVTDNTKFMLVQPTTLEDGMYVAHTMASAGVDLIVFDSIAAGIPRKALEKKMEDVGETGQVGQLARLWSVYLPKLSNLITRTNTAVIGISQLREKINTMGYGGDSTDTQGGRAWKFFAALRMKLQRVAQEKDTRVNRLTNKTEDYIYGSKIKVKLDKCKVSAQQGNVEFMYIRQGEGIDNYRTIIEVAIAHNVVKKSGSWFSWGEVKAQGMGSFRERLLETEDAFTDLYAQIQPFLLGAEDLSSSEEELEVEDINDLFNGLS